MQEKVLDSMAEGRCSCSWSCMYLNVWIECDDMEVPMARVDMAARGVRTTRGSVSNERFGEEEGLALPYRSKMGDSMEPRHHELTGE